LPLESRRLVRVGRLGLRSSPPAQPDWPLCRLVRFCCSLVRGFLAGTPRVAGGLRMSHTMRCRLEWSERVEHDLSKTRQFASPRFGDCFANRSDVGASVYVVFVVGQLRKFQSSLYMNACQSRAEMHRVAGNGGSQPRILVI
jgi:hypothetical protein